MNLDLWSRAYPSGDVIPGRTSDHDELAVPWAWREPAENEKPYILNRDGNPVPHRVWPVRDFLLARWRWISGYDHR